MRDRRSGGWHAQEVCRDNAVNNPDDDPSVATAVLADANVLCTRDKHLLGSPGVLAYCTSHGVRVIDDVELIKLLRQP